jgi:hypothetical protein
VTAEAVAAPSPAQESPLRGLLRPLLALLANVTVLTALLIYFGWRRSETQSRALGIDESILGSGTRDYLLRSVGPVLVLLVGVAVAAFAWVALDRRLGPFMTSRRQSRTTGVLLLILGWAWLLLPVSVWAGARRWPATAFVLFPAAIGVGVLLLQYAHHLGGLGRTADDTDRRRTAVAHAATALLVGVCLFWTASNYAEIEGERLARRFVPTDLPGVVLSSEARLHLEGPGVAEESLSGEHSKLRYRYRGLRLLEHTGGRYLLVSDDWSRSYGVVFMLRDGDETVRLDFVRGQG